MGSAAAWNKGRLPWHLVYRRVARVDRRRQLRDHRWARRSHVGRRQELEVRQQFNPARWRERAVDPLLRQREGNRDVQRRNPDDDWARVGRLSTGKAVSPASPVCFFWTSAAAGLRALAT